MIRGNLFKKSLSLILAFVLCLGMVPAALVAEALGVGRSSSVGYVAMGDGMTYGIGLSEEEKEQYLYAQKVADALGYADDWNGELANKRYRVEELRYLLDANYAGDGYTKSIGGMAADKNSGKAKTLVAGAELITINVGVNNFSTYVVEQMMHYLQSGGETKYSYSFDAFMDADVVDAMENIQGIVMEQLLAASTSDVGDEALEMINFVTEVSTYAMLSYITSFNALIDRIYELNDNPNLKVIVVGLYNPAEGEMLTYNGQAFPIGRVFGALTEMANAYIQILGDRTNSNGYIYVDAGAPELLIDQMGNTSLPTEQRVPTDLKSTLLEAAEDTAVSMVQEMFATYGVTKTYKEALAIVQDIFAIEKDDDRKDYVVNLLYDMVVDEVLTKFKEELEKYAEHYGSITIDEADIMALLTDLDNAADISAREGVAEEFVVDLMTKAMVGQTFAGMYIEDQDAAYEAIELLERNSAGDPDALREAAADMIMDKVGENGLNAYITRNDVLNLLEQLDTTTTTAQREVIIKNWMNGLAAKKIAQKIQEVKPTYTVLDAEGLLAAMEADPANAEAIAKNHMLTTGGFHAYMVEQFEATYAKNGLTLQTYGSFEAFVTAVEQAADDTAAKAIVRAEIRAAGAVLAVNHPDWVNSMPPAMGKDDVIALFAAMDNATDPNAYLYNWTCDTFGVDPSNLNPVEAVLVNKLVSMLKGVYNTYNDAATAAEEAFVKYRNGVDEAAEAFGQYNELKDTAADQILSAYETSYKGAGETALGYYADYLALKAAAVDKVMDGYDEYQKAIQKGMDSCDQLNEKFDKVFSLLCEIATVESISLNDLVSVGKKVTSNGNYISEMVNNLVQGDPLASDDKTVAYIALRYYLAGSMMIMPSAKGHAQIAANIVKAYNTGKDVHSTTGYWANKIIDGTLNVYRSAKAFWQKPTSASGQASTIINPKSYVALGGNITTGDNSYVKLLGDALAMAQDQYDNDTVYNLALDGLRAEDLLVLVNNNYAGDAYTDGRFGEGVLESKRDEYQAAIESAELITIEVGINNLVTYPMTQILLAYNGDDVYDMDWGQYIGEHRADKLEKGKDTMLNLLLGIANNDPQCEKALRTVSTAFESMLYSLIGYIFHLDDAVESIAELNEDATIALIGFYNPMEGTYFQLDRKVTVAGKSLDLSRFDINVSAIFDHLINIGNRYLANYVGNTKEYGNANDKDSRLLNVKILDTELKISDYDISKDLSVLAEYKEITVHGKTVTLMVPEYFLKAGQTAGEALHPNANGHLYIRNQILDALDFEIHADVYPEYNWKYYGDTDPELVYTMDDESSLYDLVVKLSREAGENVGFYPITATVQVNGGYYEVDTFAGNFEIKARPVTITVMQDATITVGDTLPTFTAVVTDTLTGEEITGLDVTITGVPVDSNTAGEYTISATLNETNYVLAEEVVTATLTIEEEETVSGTITYKGSTLSLEGEVFVNAYFTISGFEGHDIQGNSGLLIWNSKPAADDAVFGNEDIHKPGLTGSNRGYGQQTDGFAAAEYADEIYMVGYVKVGDTYYYSDVAEYSVKYYCETIISRPTSNQNLKNTCIAMLHYGAAAQQYFGYNTEDLANAGIVDQYPAEAWNDALINDLTDVDTSIPVSASVTHLGKTLSLNAAIAVNYYYTFAGEAVEAELLIWDGVSGELATDNVSYTVEMTKAGTRYGAQSDIFPAALYSKTIFACARFVDAEGNEYYSEVIAFNPEAYAKININNGARVAETCKRMVIYGEYARIYFGK